LAQVLAPSTGGTVTPISTQENLYTLLSGVASGGMWALQLPENPTHPSLVYQMVGSIPGIFEGYHITQTDTFVLNLRGESYSVLRGLVDDIITALAGQNIEITDMIHDFDQAEELYRVNLELEYTYLSAAAQTMPVAFVYPLSRAAVGPSAYDNFTKQAIEEDFAILLVTDAGDIPALQDEVQAALLGWQQSSAHHEVEYSSGSAIEGAGGLELWRETYRDIFYMTQA
jgi:hypothetical protein